jgi:hypothetical protein
VSSRANLVELEGYSDTPRSDRVRLTIDDRVLGPVLTRRAAAIVLRWLNEGGLDDMKRGDAGGGPVGKLVEAWTKVDDAIDTVADLLKHGPGPRR